MNSTSDKITAGKLVLLIDDNIANLHVLGSHLKYEGLEIALATSGEEGLSLARQLHPDLILLDIMMPQMDGYQVCRILKDDETTRDIPIIFLTARVTTEDILKAFELGAVDYVTKPFNSTVLIARANTHLKLKHYFDQIEEKNKQLEMMSLEKDEFLGIAAHDLKNPIYSISMLAKVIRDEKLSKDEISEFAQDIITTSDRMLELIKNLLDVNAAEQGRINLTFEDVDLNDLGQTISSIYRDRADVKNINLTFHKNDGECFAYADRNVTMQILDNLVSNAIKFSPRHKNIYVRVKDSGDFCRVEVQDEGPGLTDEDKTILFEKFARLSAQPTGEENSTGLGLSIVKKYVELLKGKIWVESEPGLGANFILELPAYKPELNS